MKEQKTDSAEELHDLTTLEAKEEKKDFLADELLKISKTEEGISQLNSIEIAFTHIEKLDNLQLCHNLQELTLIQTSIASLSGIEAAAHSLEVLVVAGCALTKIEACFRSLLKLRKLCMQENQIAKIENLEKCTHLQQLWLFSNQIPVIENLDYNVLLKDINLAGNKIKKITGLSRLINLQSLELSGNPILSLACIDELSELPILEQLFFASPFFEPCPITELPNYKSYVLSTVVSPNFSILDEEKLSPDQLHAARNEYVQLMGRMAATIEEVENGHLTALLQLDSKSKEDEDALDLLREKCVGQLEEVKETVEKGRAKVEKEHSHLQEIRRISEGKLKEELMGVLKEYENKINGLIKSEEKELEAEGEGWDAIVEEATFEKTVYEVLIEIMFSTKGKVVYSELQKDSPDFLFIQNHFLGVKSVKLVGACLIHSSSTEMSGKVEKPIFYYVKLDPEELPEFLTNKKKVKEVDKSVEESAKKIAGSSIIALCRKDTSASPGKKDVTVYALAFVTRNGGNNKENKRVTTDERLNSLVNQPIGLSSEKLKELNSLERKAFEKYIEHQRRIWGELDPASLAKVKTQESEINSLIDVLNSLKGQISDEHKTQEKILRDLRNSLIAVPSSIK